MPPRRPHEKSRHGCLQCKRRRVKCDEQRPRCTNCAKRQSECEYASEAPIIWANQDLNRSPASSTPTTESKDEEKGISTVDTFLFFGRLSKDSSAVHSTFDLNLRNLELMMQWCNSTYRSLSREEATDQIWQAIVPQEALSHPFLMHGILALSALHLARVGSENCRTTYISSAVGHQNQALTVFRESLGNINSSNGKAMFVFSSMVTVFAFGFPPAPPESTEILALVDNLYQVLVLCSGIVQILETARSWIVDSDLGPLLKVENDNHPRCSVPDDARCALQQLHEINDICAGRDPEHDHSGQKTAIDNIALMLSEIESGLRTPSVAVWWAVKCPKKYLESLRAHRPLALVILAYYGVILHRLRHQWWIDGWSTRILNAVWFSLNNEWRRALNWAMTEVFGPGNF